MGRGTRREVLLAPHHMERDTEGGDTVEHKLKLTRLRLNILRCKLCLVWNKAILKILLALKLIMFGKEDGHV